MYEKQAVGFIEAEGLPAAVAAADAAVKSANVTMVGRENSRGGGFITIKIAGDVGAVKAALEAARMVCDKVRHTRSVLVIPRPAEGIRGSLVWNENTMGVTPPETKPEIKPEPAPAAPEPPVLEPPVEPVEPEEPAVVEPASEENGKSDADSGTVDKTDDKDDKVESASAEPPSEDVIDVIKEEKKEEAASEEQPVKPEEPAEPPVTSTSTFEAKEEKEEVKEVEVKEEKEVKEVKAVKEAKEVKKEKEKPTVEAKEDAVGETEPFRGDGGKRTEEVSGGPEPVEHPATETDVEEPKPRRRGRRGKK